MGRLNHQDKLYHGQRIGDGMKGLLIDGQIVSWDTNKKGEPHHDDVDEDGERQLQLSNYHTILNEISVSGFVPLLTSANDVLQFFTDYKNDTNIHVDLGLNLARVDFSYRDPIWKFKEFFRLHPPPDPDDYDDGVKDEEFLWDSEMWVRAVHFKPSRTANEVLGRGGRGDVWQEKDEDWTKSFSVYNNPKKKKRRKR